MMVLIIVFIILAINNPLTISSSEQGKVSFFLCMSQAPASNTKNRHFTLPLSIALVHKRTLLYTIYEVINMELRKLIMNWKKGGRAL